MDIKEIKNRMIYECDQIKIACDTGDVKKILFHRAVMRDLHHFFHNYADISLIDTNQTNEGEPK